MKKISFLSILGLTLLASSCTHAAMGGAGAPPIVRGAAEFVVAKGHADTTTAKLIARLDADATVSADDLLAVLDVHWNGIADAITSTVEHMLKKYTNATRPHVILLRNFLAHKKDVQELVTTPAFKKAFEKAAHDVHAKIQAKAALKKAAGTSIPYFEQVISLPLAVAKAQYLINNIPNLTALKSFLPLPIALELERNLVTFMHIYEGAWTVASSQATIRALSMGGEAIPKNARIVAEVASIAMDRLATMYSEHMATWLEVTTPEPTATP